VLLSRNLKPQEWAKTHLTGGLDQPVYSIWTRRPFGDPVHAEEADAQ